jgi:hypothetical protein
MPMGIVTDTEFEKERQNSEAPKDRTVTIPVITGEVVTTEKGRGNGNIQTPESIRKLIADTAATEGREAALALGKQFGLSESSVSAYSVGANSTSSYRDRPNSGIVNGARAAVTSRALSKLKKAIHHITDDKLVAAKPRELAGIARDMAAVVKAMEPETPKSGEGINTGGGPAFVFYAPQFRKEENYDVVYAKE